MVPAASKAFGFAAAASAVLHAGAAQPPWPRVETPANASVVMVAPDMVLNGKPSRVIRFRASATEPAVASFYREQFGPRLTVENRIRGLRVIATRQGDFFHTVQLRAVDSHSIEGTVITTWLRSETTRAAGAIQTERLLPADTAIVSTLQFTDGARRSLMVVGVNQASLQANRDHIVAAVQARGLGLSKENRSTADDAEHISLTFASSAGEATVTISNAGPYRAVLIHRSLESQ